jgi:peptide/nickel transport system ATP-binding protein/oligopeptide transport system ATP-binding protein
VTLFAVEDLRVHFVSHDLRNRLRVARALNGVSLSVAEGEILGLVGESGAGKSLTALAALGLLRAPARIVGGSVRFEGKELVGLPDADLNRIRGTRMAMVVQSPRSSLDPLARVGTQVVRVQREHRRVSTADALRRARAVLAEVGIPDPDRRLAAWPHELSGGMAQRVLIAMALINEPRLLIADEPTTGLDVTVQAQVLDLLRSLVAKRGLGAIMITHDLGIIAHYCTRVAVMFAGTIVEEGPVREIFASPAHPYTRALLDSTPRRLARAGIRGTVGAPPDLYALPEGCVYADRCPRRAPACAAPPPRVAIGPGHAAACHLPGGPLP